MFKMPVCCAQAFFMRGVFVTSVGELRDAGDVAPQRSRRGPFFRPQPQQINFDVLFFERARISPAMKHRQLPHRPPIRFASPHAQPGVTMSPSIRTSEVSLVFTSFVISEPLRRKENFRKNSAPLTSTRDKPTHAA